MQQLKTLTLCGSKQGKGRASSSSVVCLQAVGFGCYTTNGELSQRWSRFLRDVAIGFLGGEWSRGEKVEECQAAAASLSFVHSSMYIPRVQQLGLTATLAPLWAAEGRRFDSD